MTVTRSAQLHTALSRLPRAARLHVKWTDTELYTVNCALCTVHCALYTVLWTPYTVLYTVLLNAVQAVTAAVQLFWAEYWGLCIFGVPSNGAPTLLCTVYSVQGTVYSVQ